MSHLPCYISSVLLALLLVIQRIESARIERGLIDKILVSRGSDELPPSMIDKVAQKMTEERKPHNPEQKPPKVKVNFSIPGMPVFPKK